MLIGLYFKDYKLLFGRARMHRARHAKIGCKGTQKKRHLQTNIKKNAKTDLLFGYIKKKPYLCSRFWKDGRVVDCGGLENR